MNMDKLLALENDLFLELARTEVKFKSGMLVSTYNGFSLNSEHEYFNMLNEKFEKYKSTFFELIQSENDKSITQLHANTAISRITAINKELSNSMVEWDLNLTDANDQLNTYLLSIEEEYEKTIEEEKVNFIIDSSKKNLLKNKVADCKAIIHVIGRQISILTNIETFINSFFFNEDSSNLKMEKIVGREINVNDEIFASIQHPFRIKILWMKDPELLIKIFSKLREQDIIEEFSQVALCRLISLFKFISEEKSEPFNGIYSVNLIDYENHKITWKKKNYQLAELFWWLNDHGYINSLIDDNDKIAANIYNVFNFTRARSEEYNPKSFQREFQLNRWNGSIGSHQIDGEIIDITLKEFRQQKE